MGINVKQLSSMKKIRSLADINCNEINKKALLAGQSFSYQIVVFSDGAEEIEVQVESPVDSFVKLYAVRDVIMDFPVYATVADNDFLTREPGKMPDLLVPIEEQNGYMRIAGSVATVWVEVKIPREMSAGAHNVSVKLKCTTMSEKLPVSEFEKVMEIEVLAAKLPKQSVYFTQWFHTDCIANAYNTEVYGEKHWEMIDKYMHTASELGINVILTPVITPPLDTKEGGFRRNTQLVKIEKNGEKYSFDFTLLEKWIELCKKNGIEYYEISHLFSQWGLKYSPNIYVTENRTETRMFGWHVPANSREYKAFLEQFVPALVKELEDISVADKCFFHLSDEPGIEHLDAYRYAYEIVKPLIGNIKIMDALSDVGFYNSGLVEIPVTASNHIEPFLEKKAKHQWVYYCCCQGEKVGNRFMSMPSYRNRILGLQIYKYGIKGFLHWGYNFYNSRYSLYNINPYITSSADMAFPSGDSFSVYPGQNGPLPSLRALIFKEALEDIEVCRLLESYIGKDAVVKLIETEAGGEITFSEYPRNDEFLPNVTEKLLYEIKKYI